MKWNRDVDIPGALGKVAAGSTMYHAAPVSARMSIMERGLNPMMGGPRLWEDRSFLDERNYPRGTYVTNSLQMLEDNYAPFALHQRPMDLWSIDVEGLNVNDDPLNARNGGEAHVIFDHIGPERLHLLGTYENWLDAPIDAREIDNWDEWSLTPFTPDSLQGHSGWKRATIETMLRPGDQVYFLGAQIPMTYLGEDQEGNLQFRDQYKHAEPIGYPVEMFEELIDAGKIRFDYPSTLPWGEEEQQYYRTGNASGDGWLECDDGETRWGLYGAAGVLFMHVDPDGMTRYLLTERSGVHMSGTWSVPGGAIDLGEDPLEASLREAREEIGYNPKSYHVVDKIVFQPATNWSYTTFIVQVDDQFDASQSMNYEQTAVQWVTKEEMSGLPLHPGFATIVPKLTKIAATTLYRVTGVNARDDILRNGFQPRYDSSGPKVVDRAYLRNQYRTPEDADPWYPGWNMTPDAGEGDYDADADLSLGQWDKVYLFQDPNEAIEFGKHYLFGDAYDLWRIQLPSTDMRMWNDPRQFPRMKNLYPSAVFITEAIPPENITLIGTYEGGNPSYTDEYLDEQPQKVQSISSLNMLIDDTPRLVKSASLMPKLHSEFNGNKPKTAAHIDTQIVQIHDGDIYVGVGGEYRQWDDTGPNTVMFNAMDGETVAASVRMTQAPEYLWVDWLAASPAYALTDAFMQLAQFVVQYAKGKPINASFQNDKLRSLFRRWNERRSMALTPEMYEQLPPYLWHVTQRDHVMSILQQGLKPASETGWSRDRGYWTPRPNHVYLTTDVNFALESGRWQDEDAGYDENGSVGEHGRRNDPVLLRIDKTHLDPQRFKGDEDHYTHSPGQVGFPPMPHPDNDRSLGEWAEEKGLDQPDVVWDSIQGSKTVAYEGTIPPAAITVWMAPTDIHDHNDFGGQAYWDQDEGQMIESSNDELDVKMLKQHIITLAQQMGVQVVSNYDLDPNGADNFYDIRKNEIIVAPIDDALSYSNALHELAHVAFQQEHLDVFLHKAPAYFDSTEEEIWADHWAYEHSLIPLDSTILQQHRNYRDMYENDWAVPHYAPGLNWVRSGWHKQATSTKLARTTMFHVAPQEARESILAQGLDPNHPSKYHLWDTQKIYDDLQAGGDPTTHNPQAVYLWGDFTNAEGWRSGFGGDIYMVDASGLNIHQDKIITSQPAFFTFDPIPPDHLKLLTPRQYWGDDLPAWSEGFSPNVWRGAHTATEKIALGWDNEWLRWILFNDGSVVSGKALEHSGLTHRPVSEQLARGEWYGTSPIYGKSGGIVVMALFADISAEDAVKAIEPYLPPFVQCDWKHWNDASSSFEKGTVHTSSWQRMATMFYARIPFLYLDDGEFIVGDIDREHGDLERDIEMEYGDEAINQKWWHSHQGEATLEVDMERNRLIDMDIHLNRDAVNYEALQHELHIKVEDWLATDPFQESFNRTAADHSEIRLMQHGEEILPHEHHNSITTELGIKAYIDDNPAGNITYQIMDDYIFADWIYVEEEYRSRGVMRDMIDYLYQAYQLPISGEFFNRTLEGYIEKRNLEVPGVTPEQPWNRTAAEQGQSYYHVSPRSARESILEHGLQIDRPRNWPDSTPGVYLFDDPVAAEHWPVSMGGLSDWHGEDQAAYDIWEVNPTGLTLIPDTDDALSGMAYISERPIPPTNLHLIDSTHMKASGDKADPRRTQQLEGWNYMYDAASFSGCDPSVARTFANRYINWGWYKDKSVDDALAALLRMYQTEYNPYQTPQIPAQIPPQTSSTSHPPVRPTLTTHDEYAYG